MKKLQIVVDTSVLIAALRSRQGAAYKLLMLLGSGKFEVSISVPLVLEYEDVAKRLVGEVLLTERDIDHILDYICRVANHKKIFFLWRPFLMDPKDDMVLELAVVAQCDFIVSYNEKDFQGVDQFGVRVVTPKELLQEIGELP
jgi:putative PIN family toxin of toxin-antitoxin system